MLKRLFALLLCLNILIISPQTALAMETGFCRVVCNNREFIVYQKQIANKFGEVDNVLLDNFISKVESKTFIKPKSAYYTYDNGSLAVNLESFGQKIDRQDLKQKIIDAMSVGGGTVFAKIIKIKPQYKAADLPNLYLRAKFSTNYYHSDENRKSNIELSISNLTNITVYPNEEFSFNQLVGERTIERGYKSSKVILGGRFQTGVGGGVCQVSTTLYNALILGDILVTEYHPHTLWVGYIERSFDAMVSYGYADLKFKNSTYKPVFVHGTAENGKITFYVFGEKMEQKIVRESCDVETLPYNTIVKQNPNLGIGESKIICFGRVGYKSQGYLIISNGNEITKRLIRSDSYSPVDFIYETNEQTLG